MKRWGAVILLVAGLGVPAATAYAHPEPGDVDGDGVRDEFDNCVFERNSDQRDVDGDKVGDRCDPDADGDGIENGSDNCWLVANPGQESSPDPRYGAACYKDSDGDGTLDPEDNCPDIPNDQKANYDYDELGDACDPDDDFDGVFDDVDNCPRMMNPDQVDLDGDGIGEACDPDDTPAPPATTRDVTPPRLGLVVARTLRLRELGRSIAVEVRCSEQCAVRAELRVERRRVAAGTATLGGRGTTYVFMRKLRRLRPARATLRLTATDAAGNVRSASRRVKLRR